MSKRNKNQMSNVENTLWTSLVHKRWLRAVIAMASVVVFVTVYSLILPAAALTEEEAKATPGIELGTESEVVADGEYVEVIPEDDPNYVAQAEEVVTEDAAAAQVQEEVVQEVTTEPAAEETPAETAAETPAETVNEEPQANEAEETVSTETVSETPAAETAVTEGVNAETAPATESEDSNTEEAAPATEAAPAAEGETSNTEETTSTEAAEQTTEETKTEETTQETSSEEKTSEDTESAEEKTEEEKTEETAQETPVEVTYNAGTLTASLDAATVTVDYDANAQIADGASLVLGKEDRSVKTSRLYETVFSQFTSVKIVDADGNDVVPAEGSSVNVAVEYSNLPDGTRTDYVVVDGENKQVESLNVSVPSTFGTVVTKEKVFAAGTLTYEDEKIQVAVKYDESAKLPENCKLEVKAVEKEVEIDETKYELADSKFVALSILDADGNNITPVDGATVTAELSVKDVAEDAVRTNYVVADAELKTVETYDITIPGTIGAVFTTEKVIYEAGTLSFTGEDFKVVLAYNDESGIPRGAKLDVTEIKEDTKSSDGLGYDEYLSKTEAELDKKDRAVKNARFFDIKILDKKGNEIEPKGGVKVSISQDKPQTEEEKTEEKTESKKDDAQKTVVHFTKPEGVEEATAEEIETKEIEKVTEEVVEEKATGLQAVGEKLGISSNKGDQEEKDNYTFETSSFSVYGIIECGEITVNILTSTGETYEVKVSIPDEAKIPRGAELHVNEISPLAENGVGEKYADSAASLLELAEEDIKYLKLLDIYILKDDEKIQPEVPVSVDIKLLDKEAVIEASASDEDTATTADEADISMQVINFSEADPQELECAEDGETVSFETDGFYVYAIVGTSELTTKYITASGETYEVTVTYSPDVGVPDGAELLVTEITEEDKEYSSYAEQTALIIDSDAAALFFLKLLDISIVDQNGDKVLLNAPVDVQIRLLDSADLEGDVQVVHFAEDADTNTVEPELLENNTEGDTVSFQTDSFSAYAIVQGPAAIQPGWERISSLTMLNTMASEGLYIGTTGGAYLRNNTANILNNNLTGLYGIQISSVTRNYPTDDAAKYYFEPVEGTTNQFYIYCYNSENNKVYATYNSDPIGNNRYSIDLTEDESEKTPCTLSVSGSGINANWIIKFDNSNAHRWHLQNNIFEATNNQHSFYIWHEIGYDQDTYGLDGKTYGLMYWTEGIMGKALMASENETSGHLDALPLTVMSKPNNGAKLYVPDESDISFWTFHFIEDSSDINSYYYYLTTVQNGSTKYLRIAADGLTLVSTPDDNCKIKVVPGSGNNAGKVYLKVGNSTLAYSGDVDEGFKVGGTAGTEWLNLVEESELTNDYFMTYSASKVSVSDESITNGSRIIVYTRVWNETTLKYEFYAIDQDGSLVRCYESGDSIEWVGGRLNSMLWNFVEYYWEGTNDPNYYYELFNQYSYTFIAPQKSNNQILSDSTIGINLNGRRNGMYYTPIVAWDDGYYAYAGLKADLTTGKVVSCPLSETDDFYFAIVQDIPVDDELTTVPTVDHTQYGITMKMVNFGTDIYTGNDNNSVQSKMSDFLGGRNSSGGYNAESGILQTQLGLDGYPVARTGNSLSEWFSNAQEANHLFIQSTYSETGYFEYDSVQNFAHLDSSTNNFVVYKQLGSDNTGGATHTHGLFWPYNDITAGVFSSNKNTTTISGGGLPNTDPRKYETMYLAQKSNTNYAPDYYFGMELTASFTQTPNGLDDWGHDIIYEFTGDDDFWLFVDGELILDLGGIHSAIPGSVNYRTGVVNVNGTITSLRALFEANYRGRNEGVSDEEVETYLNGIFDGEIFKPYTTHTMKIYYMERGAGSSNLHMRFNLASIKPGTVQLSKKLSGVETTETVLAEFPYQIIYRTKTGDMVSEPIYLSNSVANDPTRVKDYVFYKDTTVACTYKPSFEIAGKTYNDVFILKPDETVDINFPTETFPEGTELYDYRIIECCVNKNVYTGVQVNDVSIAGTAVNDDQGDLVQDRMDYGIDFVTTNDRARVVYDNAVNPVAITNLTIQKKLYDVTGENVLTEIDDNTTFDFRLYLATETSNVDDSPANMHTYHVKDPDGNYCYWNVSDQRIESLGEGKDDFTQLTDTEKDAATFHTSMNGAIFKIPIGYTIEVRDLLAGTQFKVVERPWEIPDGYSFIKYVYNETDYTSATAGVTDVISAGTAPHVEVRNIKGFGLRVNKTWTDADFMAERDPAYFGIFYEDSSNNLQLVEGSLRQMAYGTTTLYWYYDHLPVTGITEFENYSIYEVSLTNPIVDSEGKVTGYSDISRLDNDSSMRLDGKQVGDTASSQFTYTVTYDRGELSSNSNVRVDEVTNSRPGIILKKTQWDGTTALAGAVFTLVDKDGNTIGTFTSAADGLITEAFLRNGVDYTLTEVSSPQGFHGLEAPMVIKLQNETITVKDTNGKQYDSNYYRVDQASGSTNAVITVKNRPYTFQVVKMDKGTEQPLANVRFKLYREIVVDGVHAWDPNPYPGYDNIKSGEDGVLPGVNNTLPAGKYQLREISPLSGYQALSGYITFTVSETGVISSSGNQPDEASFEEPVIQGDGTILYQIKITNAKVFKVSIWKTDQGYNTITTGATFALYKAEDYNDSADHPNEGASPILTGTTGTNGILSLGSLIVGEYRLVETQAPNGYNLATSAVKITINNNGVTAFQASSPSIISRSSAPNNTYWVSGQDNSTWQIRVWNDAGVELPNTGGTGTLPYTLGGLTVMLTALMYGFRMRRRERRLN